MTKNNPYQLPSVLDHDLILLNSVIMHHGVEDQEWYKHKFGEYQYHAKYAKGRRPASSARANLATKAGAARTGGKTESKTGGKYRGKKREIKWTFKQFSKYSKTWKLDEDEKKEALAELAKNKEDGKALVEGFKDEKLRARVRKRISSAVVDSKAQLSHLMAKANPIDKDTGLPLKKKELSEEEDARLTNPAFNNLQVGTKSNCVLCGVAYEMRRRGYDVQAQKTARANIMLINEWFPKTNRETATFYKNAKPETVWNEFSKNALKQGDGARGAVSVTWRGWDAAHVMNYTVTKGNVKIVDAQNGDIIDHDRAMKEGLFDGVSGLDMYRLDNVDFDKSLIKEAVR